MNPKMPRFFLCGVYFFALSLPSAHATTALKFIPEQDGCRNIIPFRQQWQTLTPELADPEKIALIENDKDTEQEWKHLYLPNQPFSQQQLEEDNLSDLLMKGLSVSPHKPAPGLLVNSQPWIDFLSACPNMISSNKKMSTAEADWVAPYFFERYQLMLDDQVYPVISTRFRDRSSRYSGHYVSLLVGGFCPAEKLFVSQGENQKIEFLHRNGQLVMSLKQPDKRIETFLTYTGKWVDNSYFVELCRTMLRK